jgi:hypothetical protein
MPHGRSYEAFCVQIAQADQVVRYSEVERPDAKRRVGATGTLAVSYLRKTGGEGGSVVELFGATR